MLSRKHCATIIMYPIAVSKHRIKCGISGETIDKCSHIVEYFTITLFLLKQLDNKTKWHFRILAQIINWFNLTDILKFYSTV